MPARAPGSRLAVRDAARRAGRSGGRGRRRRAAASRPPASAAITMLSTKGVQRVLARLFGRSRMNARAADRLGGVVVGGPVDRHGCRSRPRPAASSSRALRQHGSGRAGSARAVLPGTGGAAVGGSAARARSAPRRRSARPGGRDPSASRPRPARRVSTSAERERDARPRARRSRRSRRRAVRGGSDASHGQRACTPRPVRCGSRRVPELPPQLRDVHVDGSRPARVGHPPDDVEQALAREHDPSVLEEAREQVELLARQLDRRRPRRSPRASRGAGRCRRSSAPRPSARCSARRRIALIRAASSRGENGFGT